MSHLVRLRVIGVATLLTLSGLVALGGPAQAATTDPRPASQGATWLAGQLSGGLMHNDQWDFDDYGLSIDTALALQAVGGHDDAVTAVGQAIRAHYYSYTSGADWGSDDRYAGAIAKALVLAQVAGTGPSAYRATVRGDLEDRVATAAPITGRIEDSGASDYANVIGQSFAARALAVAGSSRATDALSFLLEQQCAAGYFRESFSAKADADQSCDAQPTPGAGVDTTALVVLNLEPIAGQPGVSTALAGARTWLADQQQPDGSFGNANATGLAAWALGESPAATSAAGWLRAHQADDADRCTHLSGDVGALALDDDALAAGRSDGIVTATRDQWRRASAQALPALAFVAATADPAVHVTGPAGFVAAGSTVGYQVSGATAGSRLCLTVGGRSAAGVASGTGSATLAVRLPDGTADRAVDVVDGGGHATTTVARVLGARTLGVRPARRTVPRRTKVRVVVSGLVPTESVTVLYRGAVVATGHADADGRFGTRVRVGRKTGHRTIVARGQFPSLRSGRVVIRVVR
jgi:hypothetical protein